MSLQRNVVYISDENFVEIMAVSLESLLLYNPEVAVYILSDGIREESVNKLTIQAQRYNCELHFVTLKKLEYYAGRELSCQKKISKTAYFRLFMAEILPENIEKILYLDCDTMVTETLDILFDFCLNGLCGAVAEPTARLMKKKISLNKDDIYFNSGILLVDLHKWRDGKITEKFISYINEMNGNISFEDQGVLNHVLYKQIDTLPFKYNVTTQFYDFGYDGFTTIKKDKSIYCREEVENGIHNPSIIHFTNSFASERPWIAGSQHKYNNKWKELKAHTEWPELTPKKSTKDWVRKISRAIYSVLPEQLKYRFIYFANGIVRAILSFD